MLSPSSTAEVIETQRLLLTPLSVDDAPAMTVVLSDPALYRYTGGEPPSTATLRRRYAQQIEGSGSDDEVWINWIVRTSDGAPTGFVQATVTSDFAELAWVIGAPWQGRGLASEAARGVRTWLEDRGVTAFRACVHPDHIASQRVAANAGLEATDDVEDGETVWVG